MPRIIVDASLAGEISSLGEPAEFCDSSGRVLGYFTPTANLAKYDMTVPFTEEELAAREKGTIVYTTEEVLARLKAS